MFFVPYNIYESLKAFWLPSKTPEAKDRVDKPSMDTVCPIDGEKLRLKDLLKLSTSTYILYTLKCINTVHILYKSL